MNTSENLRNQLRDCLKEQEKELRKRRNSNDFMEMLSALHPDNYDDFTNSLTVDEKSEMLNEVPEKSCIFTNFVNSLQNESLLGLIFSADNCAEFCGEWLTEEKFEEILNKMGAKNVDTVYFYANWNLRTYILEILTKESLKLLLAYICSGNEPIAFFEILQRDLESGCFPDLKNKIFEAVLEQDVENQAIVLSSIPTDLLDEVLDLIGKEEQKSEIFGKIPNAKMVEILLECNANHVREIFEVLSHEEYCFSWDKIGWQTQIAIMKLLKNHGLEIEQMFTVEDLAKCYQAADVPARKFIFFEVLLIFDKDKVDKLDIFLKFYTLFNEREMLERVRMLEMVCVNEEDSEEVIGMKLALTGYMKRVLEEIGGLETVEDLFLQHFQNVVK